MSDNNNNGGVDPSPEGQNPQLNMANLPASATSDQAQNNKSDPSTPAHASGANTMELIYMDA